MPIGIARNQAAHVPPPPARPMLVRSRCRAGGGKTTHRRHGLFGWGSSKELEEMMSDVMKEGKGLFPVTSGSSHEISTASDHHELRGVASLACAITKMLS
jgi:hypothetical protein